MKKFDKRKNKVIHLIVCWIGILVIFIWLRIPCYSGTENFFCPSHTLPHEFNIQIENKRSQYIQNHSCPEDGKTLVLITTARKNQEPRRWFRKHYSSKEHFVHRFIIGMGVKGDTMTQKIKKEDALHSDFIIGNFEDTYENLIYKTHAAYNFIEHVSKNCQANYENVIFHDDDTFVDNSKIKENQNGIVCGFSLWENSWPWSVGKYKLSSEQWDSEHYFPTYCGGPCTMMDMKSAGKIRDASLKYSDGTFHMEDVLFTGIFREKAQLPKPTENKELCTHYRGDYSKLYRRMINS